MLQRLLVLFLLLTLGCTEGQKPNPLPRAKEITKPAGDPGKSADKTSRGDSR